MKASCDLCDLEDRQIADLIELNRLYQEVRGRLESFYFFFGRAISSISSGKAKLSDDQVVDVLSTAKICVPQEIGLSITAEELQELIRKADEWHEGGYPIAEHDEAFGSTDSYEEYLAEIAKLLGRFMIRDLEALKESGALMPASSEAFDETYAILTDWLQRLEDLAGISNAAPAVEGAGIASRRGKKIA